MKLRLFSFLMLTTSISLAQTNPVYENPTGAQTITQPGSGSTSTTLSVNRLEGVRYADQFSGSTSQDQINSAVSDLDGNQGIVTIPSSMSANTSLWSTPSNNVLLQDFRFQNGYSYDETTANGPQFSHIYYDFHAGANSSWETDTGYYSGINGMEIDGFADDGGNGDPRYYVTVPFLAASFRTGGSRPIWGANVSATFSNNNNNNNVNSLEVDSSNIGSADASLAQSFGINLIGSGTHKSGIALQVGQGGAGSGWSRGISLADYNEDGILLQTAESSRTADILIIPPADDTATSIVVTNHEESQQVFAVDDKGDIFTAGNLNAWGDLTASGTKHFKIDHPLDPANKYLYHSDVESPDMMNIYNGEVVLDSKGEAVVHLPDWFEALNRDFRYQLTAIGGPEPNLYVAQKIKNNTFKIKGEAPGVEISWQVTGIRHDAYAEAHPSPVEEEKQGKERGTYLHPELFAHRAQLASGVQ